jgi:hypothetical protein
MTAIGYANMYSGMENPQRELTEEEINKVKELVSKLETPYTGPTYERLGFSGFSVSDGENWLVNSHFTCWCSVWDKQELKHYEDTVGLIAYLEEILTPMVEKHYKDAQEIMSTYYEDLFRVPE